MMHLARSSLLVLLACVLAMSCREFVEGTPNDAFELVCAKFESCGNDPSFCVDVRPSFDEADAATRARWLEGITALCDDSCGDARSCLDAAPTCVDRGEPCDQGVVCCGVSGGIAGCSRATGQCCGSYGASCETSEACCDGLSCEPNGAGATTCGGAACRLLDDSCSSPTDCCSRRCVEGRCARNACAEVSDACTESSQCCAGLVCAQGACAPSAPGCHDACTVGSKLNPEECSLPCDYVPDAYCVEVAWDATCVLQVEFACPGVDCP